MECIWPEFIDKVQAYISTKEDGDLSFKWGNDEAAVVKNREKWFSKLELDLNALVTCNQPHGNNVIIVGSESIGRGAKQEDWLIGCDALVTKDKNIILGIETADCIPIFLFDPINNVIGLAHAGWRGVASNIASELVRRAIQSCARIDSLKVAIGPHIQNCCFEVQSDVADDFKKTLDEAVSIRDGNLYVDLQKVVLRQLTDMGVLLENVSVSGECTSCLKDKYYSFRRDKDKCAGSMLSVIKIKV